jgi:hypothetical protein
MASKRESSKPELPAGKRNGVPPLLKARWLATETVERISADQLSVDEFRCRFASGSGTPLIVTDCASKWPALAGWRAERLAERYPETLWRVSASCDMTLPAFLDYCAALRPGSDPRPLYMFDRNWREKCPQLRDELTVPAYFAEDLMGVLGEARRPSYSWLTVGPPLSGSSFHVDPNANSAWNATVQGSKKWLLYPNSLPPAMDGDGLTQLSLVEWFADHYDDCPYARRAAPRVCTVTSPSLWLGMAVAVARSRVPHLVSLARSHSDPPAACARSLSAAGTRPIASSASRGLARSCSSPPAGGTSW